jgi:hypothetical protein
MASGLYWHLRCVQGAAMVWVAVAHVEAVAVPAVVVDAGEVIDLGRVTIQH